jgi:glycosyltransferase involved in cell wall biosynthesis
MYKLLKKFEIKSRIVYPFIDLEKYKTKCSKENNSKYILFVRPEFHKGANIFLKIAKKMKNEKFLVVGKTSHDILQRISKIKNITYFDWINDMKKIYSKTKLVVMPSIWPEAFGRVPIEAGINGIPTVASNKGGLSESVGDGGILINYVYNIDKWVEIIRNITKDKDVYNNLSKKAILQAKKFDFKYTLRDFKNIVKDELYLNL